MIRSTALLDAALHTRLAECDPDHTSPYDAVARILDVRQPTAMVEPERAAAAREAYEARCRSLEVRPLLLDLARTTFAASRSFTAEQRERAAMALAGQLTATTTQGELENMAAEVARRIAEEDCFTGDDHDDHEARPSVASARRLPMPGPRARQFGDFSRLGRR